MTLPIRAYALMLQRDKGTRLRPSRAAVLATPFTTAPKIHWDVRLAAVETAESGPVGFGWRDDSAGFSSQFRQVVRLDPF
jgi:hypothetical protein